MSSPSKTHRFLSVTFAPHAIIRAAGLLLIVLLILLIAPVRAAAGEPNFSEDQRERIIRVFLAEHPFVHLALPRGKTGVRVEDGKIIPSEAEIAGRVAESGAIASPGDRAQITAVRFDHHGIVFELNGGPAKRKKILANHLTVGVNGLEAHGVPGRAAEESDYPGSSGSSVLLVIHGDAASLTTERIKEMLAPVLDFKAVNQAEAFLKSLPPILAQAAKAHHALVGMDKDVVICAMGRPPHRLRETRDGREYEEWIYGTPPQDVEFIRFVGDTVVSIEDMKVSGEKRVRTQDEVGDLKGPLNASAKDQPRPDSASEEAERPAPTLMRPWEKAPTTGEGSRDPSPAPPPDQSLPDPSSPTRPASSSIPSAPAPPVSSPPN